MIGESILILQSIALGTIAENIQSARKIMLAYGDASPVLIMHLHCFVASFESFMARFNPFVLIGWEGRLQEVISFRIMFLNFPFAT